MNDQRNPHTRLSRRRFLLASSLIGAGVALSPLVMCAPRNRSTTTTGNAAPQGQAAAFDFNRRTVRLNDGRDMPIIGIGMFTLSNAEAESATRHALQNGYRLIDTAHIYGNEAAVGRAVKASGIPREEIFITSKLWMNDFPNAAAEIDNMLQRLDTGYIDLLLLHHPAPHDQAAYRAMEQAVKAGKVKSIGLSNYYEKEFTQIMQTATIPPAVVQNETHPYNQWKNLKPFFARYGTVLESWYPLGGRDRYGRGGKDTLFADPTIVALAQKHGKTPPQILLRWHLQDGNIAIPGSANPAHIRENIDIFDFALSDEDMAAISKLDKQQRFSTF
ncbi:aldo/keto reductase [Uruburuella testudinis]|uniref:Aldo/keto reductase n=1 Tax=Uruburuella testudinis TaxID=1282863 RepID=A0ABY4DRP5_9NEIS|nr:aldo/keto reductase [Uruburuella testudinis]UOO81073.1 aldo/keto reductase [Uruburuella testudinis]